MRRPIDFDEEEFRESWQDWGRRLGRLGGWTGWLIILVILGLWFASGFFTVGPSEVGLVKRFGEFTRTVGPGFNYRLPSPIESVVIIDQRSVRTEEIGFRSRPGVPSTQFPVRTEEALMLTGDFNIIHVETVVQYDITDPVVFAFQVKDYRTILREAAQAVIREQIAFHTVDEALTEKREEIADKVLQELQALLDRYETGIRIINVRLQEVRPPTPEVAAAFDDVNSAVQDKERTIFEAQRYANEQLPRAEGQKQKILNQAEGYKQSRILQAQGDSARFISVLESYYLGETVTAARLYIETMEEILPNINKIILPASSSGLISLLDLERLLQGQQGGEGR
jgi:membrane protease subunit HflK